MRYAIHVTPEIVERTYNLLRATMPFKGWKLPHQDDVIFHVSRHPRYSGRHWIDRGLHCIEISQRCCSTLAPLTIVVAHEMCHMRAMALGERRNDVEHGRIFNRLADQVCRYHGFDRSAF